MNKLLQVSYACPRGGQKHHPKRPQDYKKKKNLSSVHATDHTQYGEQLDIRGGCGKSRCANSRPGH